MTPAWTTTNRQDDLRAASIQQMRYTMYFVRVARAESQNKKGTVTDDILRYEGCRFASLARKNVGATTPAGRGGGHALRCCREKRRTPWRCPRVFTFICRTLTGQSKPKPLNAYVELWVQQGHNAIHREEGERHINYGIGKKAAEQQVWV